MLSSLKQDFLLTLRAPLPYAHPERLVAVWAAWQAILLFAGSFGLTRMIASLLFGVGAGDPLTYVGMACLLVLVVLTACYVPARRAVHLDPTAAIRQD